MYSFIDEPNYNKYSRYTIFAIIIHWGKSIQSGHYISIVKRNDKWYICDDDEVKEIDEDEILVDNAYLLFYRLDEDCENS